LLALRRHLANPVTDGPAGYMAYAQMNGCCRSMIAPPQHFPRDSQFVPNHQQRKEKKEKDVGKMVCAPSTGKNKMSE